MTTKSAYTAVLKFGGSSVASATAMSRVLDIVEAEARKGRVILVASAISGCTDALLAMADPETDPSRKAVLREDLLNRHQAIVRRLFTGEERTEAEARIGGLFEAMDAAPDAEKVTFGEILSTTILSLKLRCEGYRSRWLDSRELVVSDDLPETYRRIAASFAEDADIYVAPGFIASDSAGHVTTLGRGGSDYSAALYAAAIHADSLQIWTDVPGIMTANPKDVKAARTVPQMPYQAALDMARCGAKVLYAPTVAPAMKAGIAIEIRNTFDPLNPGTRIEGRAGAFRLIGIASEKTGDSDVMLTLVTSGSGPESAEVMPRISEQLQLAGIRTLEPPTEEAGPEGSLFRIGVRRSLEHPALEVLHRAFFETIPSTEIPLYIAGKGAVGGALVRMIEEVGDTLFERTGKRLRIVDTADSSRPGFAEEIIAERPLGAVFVDATDSDTLWRSYAGLLEAGVSIVSSNRRSFAVPYVDFAAMNAAAMRSGTFLRYETTVGAALPVLSAISLSANSSDEILSIEAVVSCTLNQILGDYTGEGVSFASLVRKAQEEGLTERDPRKDLSGCDALRKLLILSRVAGIPLEEADVDVEPVVPLPEGSLDDLYAALEAREGVLSLRALKAAVKGHRLRFVASLDKDPAERLGYRAAIRIREVAAEHPAYHLRGTENAVILRSAFHPYPLVIQGAGEGARQAASSILNDILKS